jgi:hypothetical protein
MKKLPLPLPLNQFELDEEEILKNKSGNVYSGSNENPKQLLQNVLAASSRSYRLIAAEKNNQAASSPN